MDDDSKVRTRRAIADTLTVNDAIRRFPDTVAVFNAFAIDSCCGGSIPIAEAAERHGADLHELMDALMDAVRADG